MRIVILLLFSMVSFTQIHGQCRLNLKGKVLDYHNKTVLAGASITIYGTTISVISDSGGNYEFTALCPGKIELEIAHPECNTTFLPINIEGNTELDITLEHHLELLEGVTLFGADKEPHATSVTSASVDKVVLEKYASGSLGDALKELSGVSSLTTGSTIVKPVIQGLNGSRIVLITNEVRLQDQEWGSEHAPNVDLNATDRITVVKGSGALKYGGDAIGGVVIALPKPYKQKDTLTGSTLASASSNGRGGVLTTHLEKGFANGLGIRAQATYKRFGDFRAPDYFLNNTGTEQIGFTLGGGINKFTYGGELFYSFLKNELGILRAADFGNVTDLVAAIDSPIPPLTGPFSYTIAAPRQQVTHHLVKAKGFYRFPGLGKLTAQYAFQFNDRQEFDNRRGGRNSIPVVDLELTSHQLDLDLIIDTKEKITWNIGINGYAQENFASPDTGVRRIIPDYKRLGLGAYAGMEYAISDDWNFDVGTRLDFSQIDAQKFYRTSFWEARSYNLDFGNTVVEDFGTQLLTNPVFDFVNFSLVAGLQHQLSKTMEVSFNYGLASRPPNPAELFSEGLNQSSLAFELGDLRIDSENSNKFSLNIAYRSKDDKFGLSVLPYINLVSDFIALEPTGITTTTRGSFQVFEYVQNDAQFFGVDVDLDYHFLNSWDYTSSFSYLRGTDVTRDEPVINIPPPNWTNTLAYSNPTLRNLKLALKSELHLEQTRFPDNNFTALIVENNTQTSVLVDVSTPPPAYHLLHLTSSIDLSKTPGNIVLGFGVDNILNTQYRQYLNRFRLFADELGRNFSLNLKINY